MDLLRRFSEAGRDGRFWRPTTLWSWNDTLDVEEIRRQIREMARAGLGGHFIHARRGLETAYLGPEWMEAVMAATDEGRHAAVAPWLCDEHCGPSGACSGRVYGGREAFRQKHLLVEEVASPSWQPSETTVAVFVMRKDRRGRYTGGRRLAEPRAACGKRPAPDEAVLHFFYRTGEYVDVFNRDATEEFLKQTHERYREVVGREFGRSIPGIFTDEPQYAGNGVRLPWSSELPKFFRRCSRYELLDRLPELFFPLGDYRKTRFDFFQAVTRLFLLAWTMPVYQWCDRHGLALTGHLMGEDTLLSQVQWVGAAMPHYEYMHIPGIDHQGREPGSPIPVKQVASAAAQCGRTRVLCETFGSSGWDTSFDDLRLLAEWQFVLGASMVCQHLSAFTLRGARKRDFPPSLHYHQPWWQHYHLWNDYAAALLSMLTVGTPVVDVLVVHPIASAWAEYSPLDPGPVEELDARLRRLADFLLGVHADFHFGDEWILQRQGRVADGALQVGPCRYSVVVVPDATNLRRSTVSLLRQLRRQGGRVIFAGRVPDLVDGEPSAEAAALARRCVRTNIETARGRAALRRAVDPKLQVVGPSGKDASSVLVQWRATNKGHVFFFLNTDARRSVKARLKLPVEGVAVALDPATGECSRLPSKAGRGGLGLAWAFGPRESLLLAVVPPADAAAVPVGPTRLPPRRLVLRGRWNLRRLDPNILVLDTAAWRTDESQFSQPMNLIDVQQELILRGVQGMIILRLEFDCAMSDTRGRRFELVLEQPQAFEMWLNSMRTPLTDGGPLFDSALRRVDVSANVRPGKNVIELRRAWHIDERRRALLLGRAAGWDARTVVPDVELEAAYLVGDFAVAFPKGSRRADHGSRWMLGRPQLVDEPRCILGGDLLRAGYPFFAGRMMLEREVVLSRPVPPDAVLELPPFHAVTATVHVNGQEAGTVWKTPRTVPVGGLLAKGRNRLTLTLATSLRNMLGPHHHEQGELHFVTPQSFACTRGWFGRSVGHRCLPDDYNVVEFGLAGDVVLRY